MGSTPVGPSPAPSAAAARRAIRSWQCAAPQELAHTRDLPALFGALAQPDGIFSFLKDAIDTQRVALAGHGEGAGYAADNVAQPGVKAILSFSDASVIPRAGMLAGAFFLSGMSDKIVPYKTWCDAPADQERAATGPLGTVCQQTGCETERAFAECKLEVPALCQSAKEPFKIRLLDGSYVPVM